MKILILAAVEDELSGVIPEIKNPVINESVGFKTISGIFEDYQLLLVIAGPAVVNTTYALTVAVFSFQPDLIIQTGCAGGFKQANVRIGDIGIAIEEIDAYLGIESTEPERFIDDLPFPIIRKNSQFFWNRYPLDINFANLSYRILQNAIDPNRYNIHQGTFITVSTITSTDQRAKELYHQFHPVMESMEGSAAAHLSILLNLPFIEIRSVSNIVGKRNKAEWNLPLSFENCALGILTLLKSQDFAKMIVLRERLVGTK